MQVRRKLSVTVAALIVSTQIGSTWGMAAPSAAQISALQHHLFTRNYDGMVAVLMSNPNLLDDGSPLSAQLRQFVADHQAGAFDAFSGDNLKQLERMIADACRVSRQLGDAADCSIY